jgi:hypothetical protein
MKTRRDSLGTLEGINSEKFANEALKEYTTDAS